MQGILGNVAQGSNTASLYAAQAFTELVGTSVGSVAMAAAFSTGAHLDEGSGLGLGLPFWTSGVSHCRAMGGFLKCNPN